MKSSLRYTRISFLIGSTALLMIYCTRSVDNSENSNEKNSIKLVQTVLNDEQLKTEILKDFGNQQFKIVAGSVIKANQQLSFNNKPIKIVALKEDGHQIHERYPKELYVSVPTVMIFAKDSAIVKLIFHAGNATALFNLKNNNEEWLITGRQYGKF